MQNHVQCDMYKMVELNKNIYPYFIQKGHKKLLIEIATGSREREGLDESFFIVLLW